MTTLHESPLSENEQMAVRHEKLRALRAQGQAYPNDFCRKDFLGDIAARFADKSVEALAQEHCVVQVAGRILTRRIMGKASFVTIQDMTGRMQLYVAQDELGHEQYESFKHWDIGDIIGLQGYLFRTKTNELTIRCTTLRLLTKALRPLPDKWHGLADQEQRYRQRYVDLIVNQDSRDIFLKRFQVVQGVRDFLNNERFFEVETPMMHVMAGGAAARPFVTHHNALDMPLYLRIAPELYLKRLVVGGLERVYEINRNFRNEGLSTRHNPEFTMVEWYQAYADYRDGMEMTENLFRYLAQKVLQSTEVIYQGDHYDFAKSFERISVFNAILAYNPKLTSEALSDFSQTADYAQSLGIQIHETDGLGKVQIQIFEETVEHHLKQPTFVTEYPAEVSPLARRNDKNPFITDRFELFIGGREIANGFSELNDPEDQAERFRDQMNAKAAGDAEAMPYDADYIQALEYGLPPTCGVGVGIDRLTMLFTNAPSIREVILFPHMRAIREE